MQPGHGMLSLSAIATKEGIGARADLSARVNEMLSIGAFGLAAHDWRMRSWDLQAGLMARLRW